MENKRVNAFLSIPPCFFTILSAIAVWALLILRYGYRYGTGDQVELLPYTLYLHDTSLYAHDFFIQNLHKTVPNERTVMAHLLLPFVHQLEFFVLLFQFASSVVLLIGLQRIASLYISNKYFSWLAVAVALIPLNDYTLGNVELYSECLQAGGVACAIVAWAMFYFLKRSYFVSGILLSAATFIQLLDGLDVMILLSTVLLFWVVINREPWQNFFKFIIMFSATAFIYLLVIWVKKSQGGDGVPASDVFAIMFEFRHPHHFIFSSFPNGKKLIFFLLSVSGMVFFARKHPVLFYVFFFGLLGLLLYAFTVDVLHQVSIANFQFYKVSSWLKFLGVVAVVSFALNTVSAIKQIQIPEKIVHVVLLSVPILCFVIVIGYRSYLPFRVPYQFGFQKTTDDRIDICKKIAKATDFNAVFIQPFDFTELKFYGMRSCYVEFKANVRHKNAIGEWHRRIGEVYGITTGGKETGFALQTAADAYYNRLDDKRKNVLRQEGVTHVIIQRGIVTGQVPVVSNSSYEVYQL